MCLKMLGQSWGHFQHHIVQWFPAYSEHVFTSQSGPIKKSYPWQSFHKKLSFRLFKHLFLDRKSFVRAEIHQFIYCKNEFWHIHQIFALKDQEKSISEKWVLTSLERIVFTKCFWQRLVLSQHSRQWCSDFRHSVNLSYCWFRLFASESFLKELVRFTRFALCPRNFLRVLVNELKLCFRTLNHILY